MPPKDKTPFNGKDLTGFYTFGFTSGRDDPKKVYDVKDGVLRISGEEGGYLSTVKSHENYRLIVEYKWGDKTWAPREDKARSSGIVFHVAEGPDGDLGKQVYGYQCTIGEGKTGDLNIVQGGPTKLWAMFEMDPKPFGKPDPKPDKDKIPSIKVFKPNAPKIGYFGTAAIHQINFDEAFADIKGFRGKAEIEKALGEWNTLELVCTQTRIDITLNGQRVNAASKPTMPDQPMVTKGKILIRSNGAEILFRRIELIPVKG